MNLEQRESVLAEALTWLRTPYHHATGIKGVGVDCAYLLIRVFNNCGLLPDIDPRPYPMDWHFHRGEERYLSWVEKYAAPVDDPQPADIALYQFGRCISHGAIVTEWPQIIHAQRDLGCVLDHGDQPALAKRFAGFWRLREVHEWSGM